SYSELKENDSEDENLINKERNRKSQQCGCTFYIPTSFNNSNSL
ncbi:10738_t:CDS:1, partial [Funneliformis caledonium]